MRLCSHISCALLLLVSRSVKAQTTSPDNDAAALYEAADAVVAHSVAANIMCPNNSALSDTSFPYSKDGMFIRNDRPFYSYYIGDDEIVIQARQKKCGQFRDVTRWVPDKSKPPVPVNRPLAQ